MRLSIRSATASPLLVSCLRIGLRSVGARALGEADEHLDRIKENHEFGDSRGSAIRQGEAAGQTRDYQGREQNDEVQGRQNKPPVRRQPESQHGTDGHHRERRPLDRGKQAVVPQHRHEGLGRNLVSTCLAKLAAIGIQKCHAWVYAANRDGQGFWRKIGWHERSDLRIISRETTFAEGSS